jgi:hypothetical protein
MKLAELAAEQFPVKRGEVSDLPPYPGFIYAFGALGVRLVKIGSSSNFRRRERELRVAACPDYVPPDLYAELRARGEILHVESFDAYMDARYAETACHLLLERFRCPAAKGKEKSGGIREWYATIPDCAIEALRRAKQHMSRCGNQFSVRWE